MLPPLFGPVVKAFRCLVPNKAFCYSCPDGVNPYMGAAGFVGVDIFTVMLVIVDSPDTGFSIFNTIEYIFYEVHGLID